MSRWSVLSAMALALPSAAAAQDAGTPAAPPTPVASLTLAEALQQARATSPEYRQVLNNTGPAFWGVRNAYGNLLPSASVSGGMSYTGAGQSNFGQGFTRQTSALIGSNYQAGIQWQVDGGRLAAPSQQKASRRATDEDIANEESFLKFSITTQYLTTLQATAQVAVARQQVVRNQNFLDLANARYKVGQGTLIEVRQAEVQKGQSEVQLLRNIQAENEAKLELFRQMGVVSPVAVDQVALTDSFPVVAPEYNLDQILTLASEQNPALRALKARQTVASIAIRQAKSEFLPSLFLQAGWSGFTQQLTDKNLLVAQSLAGSQGGAFSCISQDSIRNGVGLTPVGTSACFSNNGLNGTGTALLPSVQQQILDQNNVFPFHFTGQPFSASLSISLPIFSGWSSRLRLSQARANEADAEESVRARGLQVETDVRSRYLAIQTAYQAIAYQSASRESARDQLRLAQDRYRLGSGNSLEVSDAQNSVQRAEGDYVNAVYDYHKALAALEAAVGRPLR